MDAITELAKIMGQKSGKKTQRAQAIYDLISAQPADKQAELTNFLFTNFRIVPALPEEVNAKPLDDELWNVFVQTYGDEMQVLLLDGRDLNLTTAQVTANFWDYICHFGAQPSRVLALSFLLYYEVVIPLLTDDERQGAVTLNKPEQEQMLNKYTTVEERERIKAITTAAFRSWPLMASVVLHELDQSTRYEERLMKLALVLEGTAPKLGNLPAFPGMIVVSDEDWNSRFDQLSGKSISCAKILWAKLFNQNTQKAGALLHQLDQGTDQIGKIILLSDILSRVQVNNEVALGELLVGMIEAGAEHVPKDCLKCTDTDCQHHPSKL